MADYSRVDAEISRCRFWRAKEILTGRLASSNYDPALFGKLAFVLDAMHDDDEAGRYYLLSGTSEGRGGELARQFLSRRRKACVAEIWLTMPKAAQRRDSSHPTPHGTIELLRAAEKIRDASQLPVTVIAAHSNGGSPESGRGRKQGAALAVGILGFATVTFILGLIELIRLAVMLLDVAM